MLLYENMSRSESANGHARNVGEAFALPARHVQGTGLFIDFIFNYIIFYIISRRPNHSSCLSVGLSGTEVPDFIYT
jgi:hypothetical protein